MPILLLGVDKIQLAQGGCLLPEDKPSDHTAEILSCAFSIPGGAESKCSLIPSSSAEIPGAVSHTQLLGCPQTSSYKEKT